jgi:HAMP domain-containing protein
MNDQEKNLRDIVERATAAGDDLPHDLDAETASLRDGWLQLGRLIEQDVQSGGAHVGNRTSERVDRALPDSRSPLSNSRRRPPAWLFWIAACAASLLVAAGVVFAWRSLGGPHQPRANLQQIVASKDPAKQPTEAVVVPTPAPSPAIQNDSHLAATGEHSQRAGSVVENIAAAVQAEMFARRYAHADSNGIREMATRLKEVNIVVPCLVVSVGICSPPINAGPFLDSRQ